MELFECHFNFLVCQGDLKSSKFRLILHTLLVHKDVAYASQHCSPLSSPLLYFYHLHRLRSTRPHTFSFYGHQPRLARPIV